MRDFKNLAHIAEGSARGGEADFRRFLEIAFDSASEVECLLALAGDLGCMEPTLYAQVIQQVAEVKKMLASLHRRLRTDH